MAAFVVILPSASPIQAEDVQGAFERCHVLVDGRAWLVADDECYDSEDARKALSIGDGRPGLVAEVNDYAGYGDSRLAKRLRIWTKE